MTEAASNGHVAVAKLLVRAGLSLDDPKLYPVSPRLCCRCALLALAVHLTSDAVSTRALGPLPRPAWVQAHPLGG